MHSVKCRIPLYIPETCSFKYMECHEETQQRAYFNINAKVFENMLQNLGKLYGKEGYNSTDMASTAV